MSSSFGLLPPAFGSCRGARFLRSRPVVHFFLAGLPLQWACNVENDLLTQLRFLPGNLYSLLGCLELVLAHQSSQWLGCFYAG